MFGIHETIWVDYSPYTETYGSIELDPTYGHTEYVRKDNRLSRLPESLEVVLNELAVRLHHAARADDEAECLRLGLMIHELNEELTPSKGDQNEQL
jgi:hypothetical protein